ncbi:MAG TPA: hypothetical protein VJ746_15795 [Nitrospira sp.]|nr:hypothetical protein [Nitrospira sp.]
MNVHPRLLVVMSLLSGLLGGILGTVLPTGSSVIAQSASADVPDVISAREFRLIDSTGRLRAILDFSDSGQPYLQFKDEFDIDRVWIGISSDSGVAAHDVDGKTRLILGVDDDGKPSLVMRDRQHRTKEFHP